MDSLDPRTGQQATGRGRWGEAAGRVQRGAACGVRQGKGLVLPQSSCRCGTGPTVSPRRLSSTSGDDVGHSSLSSCSSCCAPPEPAGGGQGHVVGRAGSSLCHRRPQVASRASCSAARRVAGRSSDSPPSATHARATESSGARGARGPSARLVVVAQHLPPSACGARVGGRRTLTIIRRRRGGRRALQPVPTVGAWRDIVRYAAAGGTRSRGAAG